jgi:hypothetical protein
MARNDFNGDGRSDLLLRSEDGGWITDWLGTANGGFTTNGTLSTIFFSRDWNVAGIGDFNGDGRDDLLLQRDDGWLTNWLGTANGGFVDNGLSSTLYVSADWHTAGTGDFNGDGRDDILLMNDAGWVTNWLGTTAGGFANNGANTALHFSPDWHIAGTGDFNGDGRSDFLLRNDAGWVTNWLGTPNGGFINNGVNTSLYFNNDWKVAGVGDFNGDGRDDILLRNDAGWVTNWLGTANGGFTNNGANAAVYLSPAWHIAGTGDFNGDGKADIQLRSGDGWLTDWLGTSSGGFVNNGANFSMYTANSWQVQGDRNENVNPITGGPGSDVLIGTWERDEIHGNEGDDSLSGLGGDDVLDGGAGRDVIHGGAGNDLIVSDQSADNDLLYGDSGRDVFQFFTFTSGQIVGYVPSTTATIMDFESGTDKIDLHLFGIQTNDHNLYWLGEGDFTGANRLEASFANGVLKVDYNGDKIPELIVNVPGSLSPSDFTYTYDPWGY